MRINVLDGQGYVELVDWMGDDTAVVNAARVSFAGESKGVEKDSKLIDYLMRNKHTSPFEMVVFKFKVHLPIFIARQWMRHRTWSYNEISRRYTSEDLSFYIPSQFRWQAENNKQCSDGLVEDGDNWQYVAAVQSITQLAELIYNNMIKDGIAREQARMILPQNTMTTFFAEANAHNLMHFLTLRLAEDAQPEIREYANAMLQIMQDKMPVTIKAFKKYRLNEKLCCGSCQ
jgi:thymidylate synthase (FAD)